ncbi:hypothetical protein [Actinomadura sp. GTD37]|uniref:hypothetical protein n=1 Tax=Actinomadura sp. GTD37 TaxID=1778030 RepID=UPI0035C1BE14
MNEYGLYLDETGAYIVRSASRDIAELRPAEPNWWDGRRLPDGLPRHMYEPYDVGSDESELQAAAKVAVRLL